MIGSRVVDSIGGYVETEEIDKFFKDRVVMVLMYFSKDGNIDTTKGKTPLRKTKNGGF